VPSRVEWPSIEAIIPTLNCASDLEICLSRLVRQEYPGKLTVLVADGGSTDPTIAVAEKYGSRVLIHKGQYATGLNGSRAEGERTSKADLIWNLDSDNFLVGDAVARDLAKPFVDSARVVLSVPEVVPQQDSGMMERWLALEDRYGLAKEKRRARIHEGYYVVEDLSFGLTNAALLRRSAIRAVGGYDIDVRVLRRLRALRLSCAAIVPSANFFHSQPAGFWGFRSKWSRRIVRFGHMSVQDRRGYLFDYERASPGSSQPLSEILRQLAYRPITAIRQFTDSRDPAWLVGLAYPIIPLSIFLEHPVLTLRAVRGMA
jgi:glycosyltransferase involved in cell wall biosynthesis